MMNGRVCPIENSDIDGNEVAARGAGVLLTSTSDIAARITRDLVQLRVLLDHAGSEEEADFVGEIAGEFKEFAQHLVALKKKRAEPRSRALKCLTAALQPPGLSE